MKLDICHIVSGITGFTCCDFDIHIVIFISRIRLSHLTSLVDAVDDAVVELVVLAETVETAEGMTKTFKRE